MSDKSKLSLPDFSALSAEEREMVAVEWLAAYIARQASYTKARGVIFKIVGDVLSALDDAALHLHDGERNYGQEFLQEFAGLDPSRVYEVAVAMKEEGTAVQP